MKHLFSSNRTFRMTVITLATIVSIFALTAAGIFGYNYITTCQKEQAYTEQINTGNKDISDKKYDTAIADFSRAIEMKGADATPYLGLAEAYIGKQNYDSAVKCLQTGFAKTQNTAFNAKMAEVTALIDNKKKAEAEAVPRAKEQQYITQLAQGDKNLDSKNYNNAITFYNEAINTDSSKGKAYLELADCYIAKHDYANAKKILSTGYTATKNPAIAAKQKAVISENEISLLKKFAATLPKNRPAPSDVTGEAGDGNDLANYFVAEEDGKIVQLGLNLKGAIIIDTNGDGHYELIAEYDGFYVVYVVEGDQVAPFKQQKELDQYFYNQVMFQGSAGGYRLGLVREKKSNKIYFAYEQIGNGMHYGNEDHFITDIFAINGSKIENIEHETIVQSFIKPPQDDQIVKQMDDFSKAGVSNSNIKYTINNTLVTVKNKMALENASIKNRYDDLYLESGKFGETNWEHNDQVATYWNPGNNVIFVR